jgi:type VI secretion system protein ImpA
MSSSAPIDIDALTAPLEERGGTGVYLRFDPVYRAIVEARREENPRLPQGVWVHDIKQADWMTVERLCSEILRDRSKDLQVACWLAEAVVHRTGFAGLACGLRLLTTLCQRFWPELHPPIEDGDLEPRLAPFEWLNQHFPVLLRNLPIVRSAIEPEKTYTWTDYANAQLLEGLRQRDPASVARSEAAGALTLTAFAVAREQADLRFWEEIKASLQDAAKALADLNATLEQTCGRDAPGLSAIGEAIKDILNFISVALAERRPKLLDRLRRRNAAPTSPAAGAPVAAQPPASDEAPPPHNAPLTREDAYAQLSEIADFLHGLEPHSPVPSLIRCAVRWGDLSFAELVTAFSSAGLDLGKVFEVLGLSTAEGTKQALQSDEK